MLRVVSTSTSMGIGSDAAHSEFMCNLLTIYVRFRTTSTTSLRRNDGEK